MKNVKYEFIGWLFDGKSDKVWGAIRLLDSSSVARIPTKGIYLIFWGRRGTRYQTQIIDSYPKNSFRGSILGDKISEKLGKGYAEVSREKLSDVYPDFEKDLSNITFWTMMTKSAKISPEQWQKIKDAIF